MNSVQAYENKLERRAQRRQARRPAVVAFRNLFGLCLLGGTIYTTAAIFDVNDPNLNNQPMGWTAPISFYAVGAYVALVAFILLIKHSPGHNIRRIARANRAARFQGHPWEQYRIEHPYMSHILVIGAMVTALNLISRRRR